MREIKFRAWDKNITKMMYFDLNNVVPELYLRNSSVLMQFIGLKDKNGKEIYEGDIIKTKHHGYLKIVWKKAGFFMDNDFNITGLLSPNLISLQRIEVISNIYETPELLNLNKEGNK